LVLPNLISSISSPWKTYVDSQYQFSLKYPPDLGVTKSLPRDRNDLIYDHIYLNPQANLYSLRPQISISIYSTYRPGAIIGNPRTLWEPIEIGSIKGEVASIPSTLEPEIWVVIPRPDYNLVVSADSKDKKLLYQILSTFRFLNDPLDSPVITPTCRPRPACLDARPRCLMPETSDMCPPALTN
jgi:hypothetical protein